MTIDRVSVGTFWVNDKKHLVREITSETFAGDVHWRSYSLYDGRPTGDSLVCSKAHILHWSDREATAEEAVRVQTRRGEAIQEARQMSLIDFGLTNASDEQLLAEIRGRGYRVSGGREHNQRVDPAAGESR
ncbi:MAG: hypothetical protein ACLQIB_03990 [Isosphaeraceae bacterium]